MFLGLSEKVYHLDQFDNTHLLTFQTTNEKLQQVKLSFDACESVIYQ